MAYGFLGASSTEIYMKINGIIATLDYPCWGKVTPESKPIVVNLT